MNSWKRLLMLTAVLGLSVGSAACGDDNDSGTNPQPETAMLRAIHASPDAPAVDIYVEGIADRVRDGRGWHIQRAAASGGRRLIHRPDLRDR